jgi:hypothetical protein
MKNKKGNVVVVVTIISIILIFLGIITLFFVKKRQASALSRVQIVQVQENAQEKTSTLETSQTNKKELTAQDIIDQINVLKKSLSSGAATGDPSKTDAQIGEQIYELSKQLKPFDKDPVNMIINAKAYGYLLDVLINGKQTGVNIAKGGTFFAQLFNSDSIQRQISMPEIAAQNFVLNRGENTIKINYKRYGTKSSADEASVELLAYGQDKVLTVTVKNSDEGTIEKSFTVQSQKPVNFATITIEK